jgi:DNA-binding response OmpR family regulator
VKVLVVDDEPLARLVLQTAVERLGHRWSAAADGESAWRAFTDDQPNVLITDLLMPGMDGLELCRRVRRHAAAHGGYTYVILATVLGDREDVVRGMEAGADGYLVKPVEFFNLQSRLIAARRVTALHAELAGYRAELSRLAHTDPLTRLGNRLSMEEELNALDARGRRYGHRYCLAMCDVDLFKAYNDTLGRHAGDEALQAVAAKMKREVRAGDGVYRYGGGSRPTRPATPPRSTSCSSRPTRRCTAPSRPAATGSPCSRTTSRSPADASCRAAAAGRTGSWRGRWWPPGGRGCRARARGRGRSRTATPPGRWCAGRWSR